MSTKFPTDEFDELSKDISRHGAHRAVRSKARPWILTGVWFLIVAVIVTGGALWLQISSDNSDFKADNGVVESEYSDSPSSSVSDSASDSVSASVSASPTFSVTPDFSLQVIVLNGVTGTDKAQYAVSRLQALGWTKAKYQETNPQTTSFITYKNKAAADTATAVGEALGIKAIKLDTSVSGSVVVFLGADFSEGN